MAYWVELSGASARTEYLDFINGYVQEQKKLGRFERPLNNKLSSVGEWLRDRCLSLARDGKLKPTWAYLQTYDDQGRKLPITYQPCESLAEQ